jgi:hypothetical protein
MLFDVAGATGEYVSLTLVFERAGAIEVPAAIRAP